MLKYKLPLKSKLYFCQIKLVPKVMGNLFFLKHNKSVKGKILATIALYMLTDKPLVVISGGHGDTM